MTENNQEDIRDLIDHDDRQWYLEMALRELKSAREHAEYSDISDDVKFIRSWIKGQTISLDDLNTNEEELNLLTHKGYASEARNCLELAQDVYEHSWIYIHIRGIKNIGKIFLKNPSLYSLKWFIKTIFRKNRYTARDYITFMHEYLEKANLSLSDIGINEKEVQKLQS